MAYLTAKVIAKIAPADKLWLEERAAKQRRTVGAIVRNLIREAREAEEAEQT